MSENPYVRAHVSLAVAGREAADLGRGIVGDISTRMPPGERIRKARRLRMLGLTATDRAVLAELSEGASWGVVADALGLTVGEARVRYEPTWQAWLSTKPDAEDDDFGDYSLGLRGDLDMAGTAESLDSWWVRHAEPWETLDLENLPAPVSQVLVDGGEAAAGDR